MGSCEQTVTQYACLNVSSILCRLQPSSIVGDEDCAACDFNKPGKTCLRQMEWVWRGETFAATRTEYAHLKAQLQSEAFPPVQSGGPSRLWTDLSYDEKAKLLKDRLKKYCQKVQSQLQPVKSHPVLGVCTVKHTMRSVWPATVQSCTYKSRSTLQH